MLINGKEIANDICAHVRESFSKHPHAPTLAVVMVGSDAVTEQFVRIKKRAAESVGVVLVEYRFSIETTTTALVDEIKNILLKSDGIIVQLPLPQHIDFKKIQDVIPVSHDVDCLGIEARTNFEQGDMKILPPVVGACKEILQRADVAVADKKVVVVGKGLLVGGPMSVWLSHWGAHVVTLDIEDTLAEYTRTADIIVLGAGSPHILKPDMIREGVVILDAGTSESGGKVVGDVDPACVEKASYMTPVPGGIGPVAVAQIFRNLMTLLK